MDSSSPPALMLEVASRRKFLKQTTFGLLALSAARVYAALPWKESSLLTVATERKFLTANQFRILTAISARMIPGGNGFPSAGELHVAHRVDEFLSTMDRPVADQIAMLLEVFELSPIFFDFKWGRFTSLSAGEQDAVMNSWSTSRLEFRRTGFLALKRLCMAVYYTQDPTWKNIGYDGPFLATATTG